MTPDRIDLRTIRVDQVGSLVNPPTVERAHRAHNDGQLSDEDLKKELDQAIVHVLAKQAALGLPVLTDGEMRRKNFQESFGASVSGFEAPSNVDLDMMNVSDKPFARAEQDFSASGPAIVTRRRAIERLKLVRNIPLEEYSFAASHAHGPVKASVLSPDRIVQRFAYEDSTDVYKDREAFLADVVAISRDIIKGLVDAGCRYVQIDAPGYTAYVDEVSLGRMHARGEDPAKNLGMSIAADNALIEGFDNVVFGIHLCRGNARTRDPKTGKVVAQFHREGHYDAIAEQLFSSLNHDRWLLEYDSERAGSFSPLRFIPKDCIAVLGLVTTKSADIETKDFLLSRLDDAGKHISMDQVAISPQCGFGGVGHVTVTEDQQWQKFERLLEVAGEVWSN